MNEEYKSLADLLPLKQIIPQKGKSERGEIFKSFLTKLNAGRAKKKLPPMTYARLAKIFEGVPTDDLYALDPFGKDLRAFWEWYKK